MNNAQTKTANCNSVVPLTESFGILPLFVFIGLAEALAIMQIYQQPAIFEPPFVTATLNTIFISSVSFVVAYMSAKSFLHSGSLVVLILGTGALALGFAGLFSGWLIFPPNGPNNGVTIHDIGALVGSGFYAASAILTSVGANPQKARHRRLRVILYYSGMLILVASFISACLLTATPPFFIQGAGPTPLGQVILGTAVFLLAISSILLMRLYTKSKSQVMYWYSLGLAFFATGFSCLFFQNAVGSPLSWAGRFAQYFGGVYVLIAVLAAIRHGNIKASEGKPRTTPRLAGALAVIAFICILIVAAILDLTAVFEPPFLVPTLNTIFIASTSFIVVYFSARSFLASGLHTIFLLSCGTLMYGLGSLTGGWLSVFPGGTNTFLTVQNTAALLSSGFIAASAILTAKKVPSWSPEHKKSRVLIGYVGTLLVIIFLIAASLQSIIPAFYQVGVGSTSLRMWILIVAVALFFLSSLFFIRLYFNSKSTLVYWYSLGLMLVAVALTSFYLQHAVGDLLGWIGRTAQYLAGIYFVVAVLTTFRIPKTRQNGIENNHIVRESVIVDE